jgi:hypothetical protein
MKTKTLIPKDRQQDTIDVLWVILRSLEERVASHPDQVLDRLAVENGYSLLSDLGVTIGKHKPYWKDK